MKRCILSLTTLAFIAILGAAAFTAAPSAAAEKGSAAGRFQLHEKSYTHTDEKTGKSQKQSDVFMLDSATGRVWIFVSKENKDGQMAKYWVEFSDRVDKK